MLRAKQLFWYAIGPALGVLSPLLAVPIVLMRFGSEGWATIAIGQSVGAVCLILVEMGWGLSGPQRVSRATESLRKQLFAAGATSKLTLMLIVSVPMCLIAEGLAGAHRLAAASAAMGLASTGLAPGWFLTGLGRPRDILLSEGLPRMAATLVASVAMFFDGPLVTFGLAQLAAGLLATPIAASRLGIRRYLIPPRTAFAGAQENLSSIGLRLTSAVYVALPTTLLAHSAPPLVAGFAAVDRLMRMELVFLQVVPLSLQREFGSCPESEVARRGIRLVMLNLAVGVIGAAAFAGVFPIVFPIAFAGELWVGPLSVLAAAGVILVCSVSRATGSLWLVRRGGIRWIWASAALGAVAVWPALSSLSREHGVPGAIAALLMVEILVLVVQCVGILLVERVSAQRVVEA